MYISQILGRVKEEVSLPSKVWFSPLFNPLSKISNPALSLFGCGTIMALFWISAYDRSQQQTFVLYSGSTHRPIYKGGDL